MNTRVSTLILSLGLVLAACGQVESVLIIDAADDVVPGDGHSSTEITVQAIFDGAPVSDGTSINLSASGGTFDEGRDQREARVQTSAGSATVTWYAPAEQGEYTISASYEDPYRMSQRAEKTLVVGAPTAIDGTTFSFSCTLTNVGAPFPGGQAVRVPCNVTAKDIDGQSVPVDLNRFGFMAEAGDFVVEDGQVTWVIQPGQAPKDVTPEGGVADGEPRWTDPAAGNLVHNPRDGIVALVVHTSGRPAAQDMMQGEPYLDQNDNGQWDADEPFFDADGNQSWTPAQVGAAEARIWRWVRILLTYEPSDGAPAQAGSDGLSLWDPLTLEIPKGSSKTVSLILVDKNLNPVASLPSGAVQDYVQLTLDNPHTLVTPQSGRVSLERSPMGLVFNPTTGALDGRAVLDTYTRQIPTYTFTIANTMTSSSTTDETFGTRSVQIRRTPYPGSSQVVEELPVQGAPSGTLLAQ